MIQRAQAKHPLHRFYVDDMTHMKRLSANCYDAAIGLYGGFSYCLEPEKAAMNIHRILRHNGRLDRKSTRLNSSHVKISYAVFCLKKKPVETRWRPAQPRARLDQFVANAVRDALAETDDDMLVFLHNQAEIRHVTVRLNESGTPTS